MRVRPGPVMARVHTFHITIKGVGGHGSQPQRCRDPIVAGAHLVTTLQTAVSRGLGYDGGAVVSVCQFNAGNTHNVIPSQARLTGTIRSFAPDRTERVLERLREIIAGTGATFGVEVDLELIVGYPVLNNAPQCADAVTRAATRVVGGARVSDAELPMGAGEDFAYFAQRVPSAYFFIGAGNADRTTPGCHHPDFDFDDDLIPLGVRVFTAIVEDRLSA